MENSQNNELKTILACQSGNMESFVLLYDTYVEKIFKFIYFRTMHKQHAEDITSQVFMRAMDKLHTYSPDKGEFQSWLYQIARNLIIDEFRKSKPTENLEAHYDLQDGTDLKQEVADKIESEQLLKLLKTLPIDAQELITMRLWDELSYAEIAEITGKSEGSLKMQFSRAISKLKEQAHLIILLLIFIGKYVY